MISTIFIILLLLPIITTSYIVNQWKRGDSLLSRRNELLSLYVTQDSNVKLHGVQLNLSTVFPVSKFLSEFASDSIKGVYAVVNNKDEVQFVGNSFDVVHNVKSHYENHGSNVVHAIRVQTFTQPTVDALVSYKNELVRQTNPWGNAIGATGWGEDATEVMSTSNTKVINIGDDEKLSSLKQSIADAAAEDASSVTSPFDEDKNFVSNNIAMKIAASDTILEFTKENVDLVLNEIRPYLIADGGNVAVAEIDVKKNSVSLILEGACGSCPSSTTTMKMGIERGIAIIIIIIILIIIITVLRENFPNLTEVINLAQSLEPAIVTELTVESVNEALQQISSAVKGMGATCSVDSVDPITGLVILKYSGPPRLIKGIELVVKDVKFVKEVQINE